jgi:hypothetical protein
MKKINEMDSGSSGAHQSVFGEPTRHGFDDVEGKMENAIIENIRESIVYIEKSTQDDYFKNNFSEYSSSDTPELHGEDYYTEANQGGMLDITYDSADEKWKQRQRDEWNAGGGSAPDLLKQSAKRAQTAQKALRYTTLGSDFEIPKDQDRLKGPNPTINEKMRKFKVNKGSILEDAILHESIKSIANKNLGLSAFELMDNHDNRASITLSESGYKVTNFDNPAFFKKNILMMEALEGREKNTAPSLYEDAFDYIMGFIKKG